jgi:hypothetical protein
MSDTDLGASLSPQEESYFETGGEAEIPASAAAAADGGTQSGASAENGGAEEQTQAQKLVKLEALHEERALRKEAEKERRRAETQMAEMRGRFSVIERLNRPQPPEQRVPTAEEDIFGAVKHTGETVAELRQRLDARDAADRSVSQQNNLIGAYRADAAQFESRTPDFKAAYNHLLGSRAQELVAIGYDSPQAVHQALLADEMAIAQMALSSGRSAAETIYNLARQRGYAPKAANGNGADRLATIERGQQANKTLSSAGGGAGDAEMSADALLKMPMDEFEAWCTKNPAKAKRIMGG